MEEVKKELAGWKMKDDNKNTRITMLENSVKSLEAKLSTEKNLRYKAEDMR